MRRLLAVQCKQTITVWPAGLTRSRSTDWASGLTAGAVRV
jgi:hypothetical protein